MSFHTLKSAGKLTAHEAVPDDQKVPIVIGAISDGQRVGLRLPYTRSQKISDALKSNGWWCKSAGVWVIEAKKGPIKATLESLQDACRYSNKYTLDHEYTRHLVNSAHKSSQMTPDAFGQHLNARIFPTSTGEAIIGFDYDKIVISSMRRLRAQFIPEYGMWRSQASGVEILHAFSAAGVTRDMVYVHDTPEDEKTILDSIDVSVAIDAGTIGPALRMADRIVDACDNADEAVDVASIGVGGLSKTNYCDQKLFEVSRQASLDDYQIDGARHILSNSSSMLADDMGLGKTRTSIVAAEVRSGVSGKVLIVCPASVRGDWEGEIKKVIPGASVCQYNKHVDVEQSSSKWYISSYYDLGTLCSHALSFGEIIIDEAMALKETTSNRHRQAKIVADLIPHKVLLDGTPMLNREREIHSLLRIGGHPLGLIPRAEFERRFSGSRILRERLGKAVGGWILRREKKDYLDLLSKRRNVRMLSMTREQRVEYESLYNTPMPSMLAKVVALKRWTESIKIENSAHKISELPSGDKGLLWCEYLPTASMASAELNSKGVENLVYTGRLSQAQRKSVRESFATDKNIKSLVLTRAAAGKGPNLQAANHSEVIGLPWSGGELTQLEDRIWRRGQSKQVTINIWLVEGTIDEDVWALIQDKSMKEHEVEKALVRMHKKTQQQPHVTPNNFP